MQMIGFNAQQCRDALASYLAEVEELLKLVEEPQSMTPDQVSEAQGLLKNLKSCLKRDNVIRSTCEGDRKMSEVERLHFAPAIHQALVDFHIRTNSKPSREWFSALYNMRITLGHAYAGLQSVP
jgi:hypothetical protein